MSSPKTDSALRRATRAVVAVMMDPVPNPAGHVSASALIARLLEAGAVRNELVNDPRFADGTSIPGDDLAVRWYAGQLVDFLTRHAQGELTQMEFMIGIDHLMPACDKACPEVGATEPVTVLH